ncbi:MAG: exodeoxyribonuclease V subunit gamma, partial [Proteobacteria bacterium]|nr:exodeoxyribonuclease V subunit gamma [Candidatus Avisuccinivibrio stercorigallinarum]
MQQLDPGFYVFNSNDLDHLALAASCLMQQFPPRHPLESEKVVVMNLGMQTYFTQFLAKYCGIAAQCEYMQVWQLIFRIHRLLHPGADERNLYSRMYLTLNILGLKRIWAQKPAKGQPDYFQKMREYLEHDAAHDKAFLLSAKLADTFDQYQMYRPQWIKEWNTWTEEDFALYERDPTAEGRIHHFLKRESTKNNALQLSAFNVLSGNVWQMHLWTLLRQNLAPLSGDMLDAQGGGVRADHVITPDEDPLLFLDRAGVLDNLYADLTQGRGELANLPQKVFIFGVSALPPQVIEFLQALSQRCAVCLMLLNPCAQYWGDLTSQYKDFFARFSRARRLQGVIDASILPNIHTPENALSLEYLKESLFDDQNGDLLEGNSLLLGLGRQGMDNLSLLCSLEPMPQFTDLFHERECDSLLHTLQQQLLSLERSFPEKVEISPDDTSLEVHICHTKLREMEVLRDAILRRFKEAKESGPALEPREIVVMVPTINDYAPYISAVFGSVDEDDPNYLPYAISDRTQLEDSPVCDAVLALLNISSQRISNVLAADLLSIEPLSAHFGISPDDVAVIESWFADASIFWGLDDEDTKAESRIELPGTFERGLDRMLCGTMAGELAGSGAYSEIEGDDALLLGRLYDFIDKLKKLRAYFTPHLQLSPDEWQHKLEERIFHDFFDEDENTLLEKQNIMQVVEELRLVCQDLKEQPLITLPVFHALLESQLSTQRNYSPFLRGRINFCSLVPMRAVPFRHIFILGLNDGEFPRRERMPGFNLLGVSAMYRRGDRSRALDDRFLFLDALLSARDSIYFSYIGESPVSQQELSPSVVLTELFDYISDNFKVGAEGTGSLEEIQKRLTRREHLNAYNPDNYRVREEPGALPFVPSFDAGSCIAGQAKNKERQSLGAQSDWGIKLENPCRLDLSVLQSFLSNPCRYFLTQVLKIRLDKYSEADLSECEDFERSDFDNSAVILSMLQQPESKASTVLEGEVKGGRQPFGIFGKLNAEKITEHETAIRQALQTWLGVGSLSELHAEHVSGAQYVIELPKAARLTEPQGSCTMLLSADFNFSAGARSALVLPYPYSSSNNNLNSKAVLRALCLQLAYFLKYGHGLDCVILNASGGGFRLKALSAELCKAALEEALSL